MPPTQDETTILHRGQHVGRKEERLLLVAGNESGVQSLVDVIDEVLEGAVVYGAGGGHHHRTKKNILETLFLDADHEGHVPVQLTGSRQCLIPDQDCLLSDLLGFHRFPDPEEIEVH